MPSRCSGRLKNSACLGLNGSGRAPRAATLELYRSLGHHNVPGLGILAATVPGAVHAWETLHERLGRLAFADVLEPAIRLARDGFPVSELVGHYWFALTRMGVLQNDAARACWAPGGEAPRPGSWFRVPALAASLERIAAHGAKGFYSSPIADAIVATSDELGGCFAHSDLEEHRSTWVDPIETTYRGVRVAELPPNGQGLAALIGLNILEELPPPPDLDADPRDSAAEWHQRIEAIKLAFADRDAYVADPEHAQVPVEALLERDYARRRAALVGERALETPAPGLSGDTVYLCTSTAMTSSGTARNDCSRSKSDRMRRDAEPRPRLEIVEAELDAGVVERDVGAALDVGGAAARVVDRLAVHGDAHRVELVGALRTQLPGDPRDVHALVIVERHRFVVHDLHAHERLLALDEAGVDDVVGLDVAAALVLGAGASTAAGPA